MKNFCYLFLILTMIICMKAQDIISNTDEKLSLYHHVINLLSQMTLEEKIGQMTQVDMSALEDLNDITKYAIGSVLSGGDSDPIDSTISGWLRFTNLCQKKALETRLEIPILYGIDAVHGNNNIYGAVIFPHNIGLGCTNNTELVKKAAQITAKEVAASGIHWSFAPCVAVTLDERWGRTYESFGETAEITSRLGKAAIDGYQGNSLKDSGSILACAKHYVGDGGTSGGVDQGNTETNEKNLREVHLPGFIEAIKSGVGTIMASFNSWNGDKLHGHKYLLTDVLKVELGFEGFIISDWAGVDQVAENYKDAVEQCINAGIDMVMVPNKYKEFIKVLLELVYENRISEERINDAVSKILRIKYEMGLFENPFRSEKFIESVGSDEHRSVARECVQQSMVLLKNDNNILPVRREQKVLLAGSHANNLGYQCGGWSMDWQGGSGKITSGTTILEAFQKTKKDDFVVQFNDNNKDIADHDIAIVVIGEKPYAEGQGDSNNLSLRTEDISLIKELHAKGKPVALILISGRPLILEPVLEYCDAVVAAWLPGTEGDGIVDVLVGDNAPTGKLSISWPRSMMQIPVNIGDTNYAPLFKYGFGLTY